MIRCSSCGANNLANTLFCEECGSSLIEQGQARTSRGGAALADQHDAESPAPSKIHVAIKGSGHTFRVPYGQEVLFGRRDPQSGFLPTIDLTDLGGAEQGVSRRHARIFFRSGQPYIEDVGSTNGTWLGRQQLESFLPYSLEAKVEISLGNMVLLIDFV